MLIGQEERLSQRGCALSLSWSGRKDGTSAARSPKDKEVEDDDDESEEESEPSEEAPGHSNCGGQSVA